MKPPRLSRAQWELLRKLPDEGPGLGLWGSSRLTAEALRRRGLARRQNERLLLGVYKSAEFNRTLEGRALIEAEDKRIAEERQRAIDGDRRRYEDMGPNS